MAGDFASSATFWAEVGSWHRLTRIRILWFQERLVESPGYIPPTSFTPPKSKIDTKNDGLENVAPFKYGHFWYLC